MKKIIILCLVLTLPLISLAQKLFISDSTLTYDSQERASVEVRLEPNPKVVKENFQNWMKEKYDVKLDGFGFLTNKDVLIAEKASLPQISDKQLDFFLRVVEEEAYTRMSVFGSLGYDIHLTPEGYPRSYQAMKGMVLDFLNEFLPIWYEDQVSETQEILGDLEKEREKLQEEIVENTEEIEELTNENVELKSAVEDTQEQINKTMDQLDKNRDKLNSMNQRLQKIQEADEKVNW